MSFAALRDVLRNALGPTAREVHHVGSTAVPALSAKPIIDIDVERLLASNVGPPAGACGTGYSID
jgi:GrpB-like predicted nucleotidyltransferase (UPF0157 family)